MDALLQRPEVEAVVALDDDLAVDHGSLWKGVPDGFYDVGEVAGHRPLLAAADLDLVAVAEHDRAEAVPLGLVELAGRDPCDRLREHRRDRRHHGQPQHPGNAGTTGSDCSPGWGDSTPARKVDPRAVTERRSAMSTPMSAPYEGARAQGGDFDYFDYDDSHGQGLVTFAGVLLLTAGILNAIY